LLIDSAEPIVGGMSGSPILQAGAAIGVVSTSIVAIARKGKAVSRGPSLGDLAACLALDLPARLLPPPRRARKEPR